VFDEGNGILSSMAERIMGATKLHINIHQGIIDVEGDSDLVLRVYEDFRVLLLKAQETVVEDDADQGADGSAEKANGGSKPEKTITRAKRKPRRTASTVGDGPPGAKLQSVTSYKPSLDKTLDTSKLMEFLVAYEPKNNAEYILIFAKFLSEKLGYDKCTMNQIYSCFSASRTKFPKYFGQSFIDTRGNGYGYIDFTNPDDIAVTMLGQNHFNHGVKKKVTGV
jgi:hypothetical protein